MIIKINYTAPEAEELVLLHEGALCSSIDTDLVNPGRDDDWGTL